MTRPAAAATSATTPSTTSSPASPQQSERVIVLDFGSQYAQLIARRVREQHVYCEIVRHDIAAERIRALAPPGIILSGGPASVYEDGAPRCDPNVFKLGIPVLGICYGMQLAYDALGGRVGRAEAREYGRSTCEVLNADTLFAGVPSETEVWMSHGDQVDGMSAEFVPLARTATCPFAAVRHATLPIFGLQFHPEVTHTPAGGAILGNFLMRVCGCSGTWRLDDFATSTIASIRQRVGSDRVICGLSGGVDSAVVAALLSRAIGDQLSCILVDNGLLRKGEAAAVTQTESWTDVYFGGFTWRAAARLHGPLRQDVGAQVGEPGQRRALRQLMDAHRAAPPELPQDRRAGAGRAASGAAAYAGLLPAVA